MSTAVHFTFDPQDEGVSRVRWLAWAGEHGFTLYDPMGGVYHASPQIEAVYVQRSQVTLSTVHMGPGVPALAELALDFWVEFGGQMHAAPELRGLIRARYLDGVTAAPIRIPRRPS